ncbi:MAG: DNA repair protein RecO [Planctomycetia bacterium]|nr:DNA repair protein RecO [Planctomycetia bacterium]
MAPPINEDGIILRTVDFSNTSCVVTFFTREHGKIACLAKGGRRLKNAFDFSLDYMNLCKILYYPKSGDTLDLVTESKLCERFRTSCLPVIYGGFHVVNLLDSFTEMGDSQPELFDLTKSALMAMVAMDTRCRGGTLARPPEILCRCLLHYELRLLAEVGLAPSLHTCVECSADVLADDSRRVALGMLAGGVLCEKCRHRHTKTAMVSRTALLTLRQLARPGEYWEPLQIGPRILGEIRGVWTPYLAHQLEHPAPVLQWLKR